MSRFLPNAYLSPSPSQLTNYDQDNSNDCSSLFSRPFILPGDVVASRTEELPNQFSLNESLGLGDPTCTFSIKHQIKSSRIPDKKVRVHPLPAQYASDSNYTLDKPQCNFQDSVDNMINVPFIPKLPPHKRSQRGALFNFMNSADNSNQTHPYKEEIEQLTLADFKTQFISLLKHQPQANSSIIIIDSSMKLEELIQVIEKSSAFIFLDYVDHKFRSYYGFICWLLIQTSDNTIYLVDCIKLRSQLIELVRVCANPTILKVIPSENFEVTHLQRDFGLYLVNVAQIPQSTAIQNKINSDWRIRPLDFSKIQISPFQSNQLMDELAILDNKQNDIESEKFITFINNNFKLCLDISRLQHQKQLQTVFYSTNKQSLSYQVLQWRDDKARFDDESLEYVLPQTLIDEIVAQSQIIKTAEELIELSKKILEGYVPYYLEQYCQQVFSMVLKYKEQIEVNQIEQLSKTEELQNIPSESLMSPEQVKKTQPLIKQQNQQSAQSNKSNYEPNIFKALNWSQTKPNTSSHCYGHELATPERQYRNILTQKNFTPSFFIDSIEHKKPYLQNSNTQNHTSEKKMSEGDDSASSFKLNKEPCLNIFNRIKCFSERVSSPEQKKYLSSLEQINERDEEQVRKLRDQNKSHSIKYNQQEEYERIALEEGAPETLQDIFKISNRNRKRNKQKKKVKNGMDVSEYSDSSAGSSRENQENIYQIISKQYYQDQGSQRNNNTQRGYNTETDKINKLNDLEFMKYIGWIDDTKLQELQILQNQNYQQQYSSYNNYSGSQSYNQNSYHYGGQSNSNSYGNNPQRRVFQPQTISNHQSNNYHQQQQQQQSRFYNNQSSFNNSSSSGNYWAGNSNNNNNCNSGGNNNPIYNKKSPISFQKQTSNVSCNNTNNANYPSGSKQQSFSRQLSYGQKTNGGTSGGANYKGVATSYNNNSMIYSPKDQIVKKR
ncbi:exosome component 10 [Stylonychia lemnae]|uniref:Exosome component 10 n=1 Tax=Stylonychia lemnae TaxID=5949 RepID=A0A078ALH5_STYLE|nr:exosome component 10 [Stylonychia lemnae]|eukprot:CDW82726.1 exosome component 10 [Stylonychia lemnae]